MEIGVKSAFGLKLLIPFSVSQMPSNVIGAAAFAGTTHFERSLPKLQADLVCDDDVDDDVGDDSDGDD